MRTITTTLLVSCLLLVTPLVLSQAYAAASSPMQSVDTLITGKATVETDRMVSIDIQNHGLEPVIAWSADITEHRASGKTIQYFYSHDYVQTPPQGGNRGIAINATRRYRLAVQGDASEATLSVEVIPTAVVLETNIAYGTDKAVDDIFARRQRSRLGFEEAKQMLLALKESQPSLQVDAVVAKVTAMRGTHLSAVDAAAVVDDIHLLMQGSTRASEPFTLALSAIEANRVRAAQGEARQGR